MSPKSKSAFGYTAAIAIPILFGAGWSILPAIVREVPATLLLLVIALVARWFGFRPALLLIFTSTVVMWWTVSRFFPMTPAPLALRLLLSFAVAIVIASISRRGSEEVREAEERFRALVELAPDGIGIAEADGTIQFANSALARIVGASDRRQLIGRKTSEFFHPDYAEEVKRRWQRLYSGQPVPFAFAKWVRFDGRIIDVEVAGVPVQKSGKTLYQGFVRDLTERNAAAAKLEEHRVRLEALFDTAIDAIMFVDSEGRYVDANPAAVTLTGYEREEILQKTAGDFMPADRQKDFARIWQTILDGGESEGEFTIRRKDGTTRQVEYRASANVLPGLHYTLMHDVTARKNAEKSLRQLSVRLLRLQDDERRRIARELHDTTAQNLVAIRLNLSRIRRSAHREDKPAVDESIALAEQSINEIRTLSYLLHPPLIDEAGLLPSLRWFARGFHERTGIEVTFEAPLQLERLPPEVETALFRMVQEALTNVQRHSGSTVATIRVQKQAQRIRLEVEDEGRGLPSHLRERSAALAASGVGIAGIQERVRELGGEVQIGSEERGTKIIVTLPVSEG